MAQCKVCGIIFTSPRRDAVICSSTCRSRLHRKRQQAHVDKLIVGIVERTIALFATDGREVNARSITQFLRMPSIPVSAVADALAQLRNGA